MTRAISFEARDYPLKDVFFSTSRFMIPRYQRPYAWSEDQIEEFWNDLTVDDTPVFLGSFILNKESLTKTGYLEVIDGQQRMLTVTVFMAVLRDLANELDQEVANLIQDFDIAYKDRDGKLHWRIICGETTQPYFERYVQENETNILDSQIGTMEEARIKAAYVSLKAKVQSDLARFPNDSDKVARLKQLRDQVSNLAVIRIDIDSEEDAYEIFETTNARGIDLSVSDLVKNLIFKNVPVEDDRDLAKEIWGDIVTNVEDTDTEMKRFIRYFWISKHPSVSDKRLFKTIKRKSLKWDQLLSNLWNTSYDYNKLLVGGKDAWLDYKHGADIFRSVSALRYMAITQCYVLFLSILRNYEKLKTDPRRIFELIENFSFNYSAVCKLPTNKIEKLYSHCGNEIERIVTSEPEKRIPGSVQRAFEDLEKDLEELRPSYEVFKELFLDISYGTSQKKRQLIKYILERIERHLCTGEKDIDFDMVNIEHVLPQKPSKEWELTQKQIKPYVDKLGNLTLVHKEFNSAAGNKDPKAKVKEFSDTDMIITQELVSWIKDSNFKWGEEEIRKRQEELAEIAYYKVWNF